MNKYCDLCGSPATSLGNLGKREFFRCIGCGIEFSVIAKGKGINTKTQDKRKTIDLRQARKHKQARQLATLE